MQRINRRQYLIAAGTSSGTSALGAIGAARGTGVLGAVLLAACGRTGPAGEPAALPPKRIRTGITLTWRTYINSEPLLAEVNTLWAAKHPDIKLNHAFSTASTITQALTAEIAAGTPVDVAMTGYADIPALQLHLANIEPYARRDRYSTQDFVQAAINQYKYGNGQYAMPHSFPVRVGAYNTTMFAQRGVKPPPAAWNAPGWTWDDFVNMARAMNNPGATPRVWAVIWQQMGLRPTPFDVIQFCINNGGAYLRDDGKECLLTQPRSREALQFIQDLVQRHRVAPAPEELDGVSGDQFIAGRAAWGIWGPVTLANYRRQISFDWALCPIPLGPGARQRTPVIGASAWMMLDGGQNKEEAWEFIQTLTSPEYERKAAELVGYVPPRRSVMTEYASSEPPRNFKMLLDAAERTFLFPKTPWIAEADAAFAPLLNDLWAGRKSANAVAEEGKRLLDPILQKEFRFKTN